MFKDIDLIKNIVDKDFYVLCVIKKTRQTFYKTHIRSEKRFLNLIHFDICNLITFRDYYNNKYFVIFFDDWDKRLKMKIIEYKSETFSVFKRYQTRNQKEDFKIRCLRTDYDEKYEDYDFDCYRVNQDIS